MSFPTTYSDWVLLLGQFGDGDDASLEQLRMGTFSIDAGTAARFYLRVEEVYKKRKQSWLEKFQYSFRSQNFKSVSDFDMVLRNGRQNLYPLARFIALKGLPEDLKTTLKKDLEEFVAEIQQSLKDNVSKSSKEREKMLILLSAFGINNMTEIRTAIPGDTIEKMPPLRRKIIF